MAPSRTKSSIANLDYLKATFNCGVMQRLVRLSRLVIVLSLVSLFMDMASEMLYPVMPMYLSSIHFSVWMIGVLEGLAEATAGLSKGYFGKWSDRLGKRMPFVKLGYAFSALSKPLMVAFTWPVWVFGVRTLDRAGKGLRTGARDALLSQEAKWGNKGQIFGFHRSMDTLGAALGPAVALLLLWIHPGDYTFLFLLAFAPALVSLGLTFLVREKPQDTRVPKPQKGSFWAYWRQAPASYRKLLIGLLAFALINSSDLFLILRMKDLGFSDVWTIGAYIFYNLIYAAAAYPMGVLADRIGVRSVFVMGLGCFALVYSGMWVSGSWLWMIVLFLIYGIYAAATEGVAKAWISVLVPIQDTGTAIGTYHGYQSVMTLVASSLAGWLWWRWGVSWMFGFSSLSALVLIGYFLPLQDPRMLRKP